jgi:YHS domain-containing protein
MGLVFSQKGVASNPPPPRGNIIMTSLEATGKNSPTKIIDPVCGMDLQPDRTKLVSVHNGLSYWFCAETCRRAFEEEPNKYLEPKPAKKKSWFGRYLDRMAKTNEKEFGCAGPKCHWGDVK